MENMTKIPPILEESWLLGFQLLIFHLLKLTLCLHVRRMQVLYKLKNLNTDCEGPWMLYLFRFFQWPFVFDLLKGQLKIPVLTTLYCLRVEITSRIYSVIRNLVCLDIKHKDIGKACCLMSTLAEEYALNLHKFECHFL